MTIKLTLEPVTIKNRIMAERLEVFPHQVNFVESVRECLKEADELSAWHPVCIWDGDTLIGFAMYGKIPELMNTRLWFDRFLLDKHHQGKGYAKPAFRLVLDEIQTQYPNTNIYLSVYEENQQAITLYQSMGFHFTGELDTKGEKIMLLADLGKLVTNICSKYL